MSLDLRSTLPTLTPEQAAHSGQVMAALRDAIQARSGWLPFDDYLRLVLYAPGLGYYSAGSAKFGATGDFVTAPELSGLFARCLAVQCAQILGSAGGELLELGAGTGRLALDLMTRLAQLGQTPARYGILEVSAELRERQQSTLQQLPAALRSRVHWLRSLPASPITGVILANEVADALPFKRFAVGAGELFERGVALSADGALIDADRPAGPDLAAELMRIAPEGWPPQYLSEALPDDGTLDWLAGCGAGAWHAAADRLWLAAARVLSPAARSAAPCAVTTGSARTISHCCIRACRTSLRGWISPASPRAPWTRDLRSRVIARRRRSCWQRV